MNSLLTDTIYQGNTENTLFPVFLRLERMHVLLVGAGNVGLEKLTTILRNYCQTSVLVVADRVRPEIESFSKHFPNVQISKRGFNASDLDGISFAILATDDYELHTYISELASERGILLNVADTPELCDVFLGSIVEKRNLKIGISTNGKSPTMAKRLKEVLNDAIPNEIDDSIQNLHKLRSQLKGDFAYKVQHLNEVTKDFSIHPKGHKIEPRHLRFVLWIITFIFLALTIFILWNQEVFFRDFVHSVPPGFYYFLLGGFLFALIDGAIGMSYGVTTTTFSLWMGVPPASASMGVHISEILSNGVAGWMHYRLKNVNLKMFKPLVIGGSIGAIIGATLLSVLEDYAFLIRPVISLYTLTLGVIILNRCLKVIPARSSKKITRLGGLGLGGGFLDAIGGGGWGSIVFSSLVAGRRNPRYALGSVKLSRFFIALFSSLTFMALLKDVHWYALAGLIIGSVVAAPIAVKVSHKISVKVLMIAVGIIVTLASIYNIYNSFFDYG